MRSYLYLVLILFMTILWSSCRKDFEFAPSMGNLEFSRDTVFLDTVFSNIGSSTRTLKIYNRNNDDLEIPSIRLGQGQDSDYRLNVDGIAGKEFSNIPILAQDSIFVFIETTFDAGATNEVEFLYTDAIQFDSGDRLQEVQLVTLVKDAVFLFPPTLANGTRETVVIDLDAAGNEIRVEGFSLEDDQLNFTNEKPYVVYGYATVPLGKELVVDAGARVHFHKDSGLLIQDGASLQVNGTLSSDQKLLENEVIFEGDRLEPELSTLPGQWGTVFIAEGSNNNLIDHLTLKNATVGLLVEGDGILEILTLTLKNSQIYNSTSVNLWAKTAALQAENVVLGSAGNASLYCNLGGEYTFVHSTIANYWRNGFRGRAALEIDNFTTAETGTDLTQANFINCIIDGNNALELALRTNNNNQFNYTFTNCLIKFRDNSGLFDENELYNFENTAVYDQILLNQDADFNNPRANDFNIDELSEVSGKANLEASLLVPLDILGVDRTLSPDLGAYEIADSVD